MTFIDIGANIGDSVAFLRQETDFPILCIEGDNFYFGLLKQNLGTCPHIYFEQVYLSNKTDSGQWTVIQENGTARLIPSSSQTLAIKTLMEVLKDYPTFQASKMIKLDTDGFDCCILRGAVDFLKTAKPVIFFEYDPYFLEQNHDDGLSIFPYLKSLGYQSLFIYDNCGDYMVSLDINDSEKLIELHNYFSGRQGQKYMDICVFHHEDQDITEIARQREMISCQNFRSPKI
jgi:FkbM family methyltransferase